MKWMFETKPIQNESVNETIQNEIKTQKRESKPQIMKGTCSPWWIKVWIWREMISGFEMKCYAISALINGYNKARPLLFCEKRIKA